MKPPSLNARLGDLDERMLRIVTARRWEVADWHGVDPALLQADLTPLRRVSYLARHFFDCQLFVATEKTKSQP
jgi:hypothetical protein